MGDVIAGDLRSWLGRTVYDRNGDKIGTVADIYVDNTTGQPDWLAVNTGLFGKNTSFVPLEGADLRGDSEVVSAYDKDQVKGSPNIDPNGHLTVEEETRLYEHYRGSYVSDEYYNRYGTFDRVAVDEDYDDTDTLTRSEEELDVVKRERQTGTARLKKWVETENVNITVPVRRERARLVTEPLTGNERITDLGDDETTVTLSEEEVDVTKRTVAKEKVRLEKDVTTEETPVSDTVRKERIEVEGDVEDRRTTADDPQSRY